MTQSLSSPDLAALLSHGGWLQRLAAHLVSGHDGADDLVQEAWLAALRCRPENPATLRPWLGQVLRNALRRRARDEHRRRAREQETFRLTEQSAEPASATMERLELQHQLTEMVAALDEPYASTLVMRYFEGRTAADIARAQGLPEGTVRWRTKKALDRLRVELDQRRGSRKAWTALLLPLAAAERTPVARTLPSVSFTGAMGALFLLAAVLLVGGAAGLGRYLGGGSAGEHEAGAPLAEPPVGAGQPPGAAVLPAVAGVAVLEGLVRTEAGVPVAGARVAVPRRDPPSKVNFGYRRARLLRITVTGADGRFRMTGLPVGELVVGATHPDHAAAHATGVVTTTRGTARCEVVLARPQFVLSGQVRDSGQGPIAGAEVLAPGMPGSAWSVVTDTAGQYRLPLASRISSIQVEASGYAPTSTFLRVDADTIRDFVLLPEARLEGRVVLAADRTPVAGAEVRLLPTNIAGPERWEETATTDEGGGFRFTGLPAGDFRLVARRGPLHTPALVPFLPEAGAREQRELTLVPGVAVAGRLTTPDDHGIADAGIFFQDGATSAPAQTPLHNALTDASGRFAMEGVMPGRYRLRSSARGFAGRQHEVTVPAAPTFDLALVADPTSVVTGVVLTADGRPAAGARLGATTRPPGGGTRRRQSTTAGPDGRFELPHLGSGDLTISAAREHEAAFFGPALLGVGERKEVTIQFAPGAMVAGVARWEDGRPAAGVKVHASPQASGRQPFAFDLIFDPVWTDGEGRFATGPFVDNDVVLFVEKKNQRVSHGSGNGPGERRVTVRAGQRVAGIELRASTGSHQLAGVVLDPHGRTLAGATVIAVPEGDGAGKRSGRARQATSAGDGAFTIDGLGQESHAVWAVHPDHADVRLRQVAAPGTGLRLRFTRPIRLDARMVRRAGQPVTAFEVVVIPVAVPGETAAEAQLREGTWDNPRIEVRDALGRFEVTRLAPGRYAVTANSPDGLIAQAPDVALAEGETKRLTLVGEPGAVITGRVVEGATGAPLPGARVSSSLPGFRSNQTLADSGGTFRLTGVLPGPKVRLYASGLKDVHRPRQTELAVPALGAEIDLGTVRLERVTGL